MLYFDHNSTTPVDSRVLSVMERANCEFFGNASSIHRAGQNARQALEQARRGIAGSLAVQASEVVFTSGGTESNNLAIRGMLSSGAHAVTSAIEHPAVLEPFRQLEREGVAVSYVSVRGNGTVDAAAVAEAIRPETALVSLMTVNNETGALQPVAEVAAAVRERRSKGQGIWFHSDGVQAAGKMKLDVSQFDLFSLSGHKIYAPKGIGVLCVRKGVDLKPMQLGGRHERGFRAGTENVAGAMALACALGVCTVDEQVRVTQLRDEFEQRLLSEWPEIRVIASSVPRLGNTSNIFFPGTSGEALLIALDMRGMCVSAGSACSSGTIEPSPVLLAMGLSPRDAKSCLRFSFGRGNSRDDIHELAEAVSAVFSRMREKQLV